MLLNQIIPPLLERCNPNQDEKGKDLSRVVDVAEKNLLSMLADPQKLAFRQYVDAVLAYQCFEQEYFTRISFSFGGKCAEEMCRITEENRNHP